MNSPFINLIRKGNSQKQKSPPYPVTDTEDENTIFVLPPVFTEPSRITASAGQRTDLLRNNGRTRCSLLTSSATQLQDVFSIRPAAFFPVSYTHLDVYKRQRLHMAKW